MIKATKISIIDLAIKIFLIQYNLIFIQFFINIIYMTFMPFLKLISISLRFIKKQKRLDISGIEPEAFRMQIERDTTTPYTRTKYYS